MEGTKDPSAADRAYLIGFAAVAASQAMAVVVQLVTGSPFTAATVFATAMVVACMLRIHGLRGTLTFCGLVILIPFASEFLGILTGLPFGTYEYVATPGPRVFGLVPVFILVAWLNITYLSIGTTTLGLGRSSLWLAPVDGLVATAWDVIVDPLAVRSHYWSWVPPGEFFGVPLSNFLGWFVVVTLLSLAARSAWARDVRAPANTSRLVVSLPAALLFASAMQFGTLGAVYGFLAGSIIGLGVLLPAVAAAWDRLRSVPRTALAPSPWVPTAPAAQGVTAGR